MDSSLAILIGGTAAFAGTVAHLVARDLGRWRAASAAAGAAAGVAASFLLMLGLATVAPLPVLLSFVALASGAVAYLAFRHDLGGRRAAAAAAGTACVVTAGFLFVVYLAVIAFVAAVGAYLLLRTRLRIGPAMVLMGTTLGGLLAASAMVFWVSLTYSM